jgi:hypothetical protein
MKKTIRNFSLCPFPTLRLTGSFSNFFKRGQNEDEIINAKLSKLNITTLSEAAQKSLWAAVFIKKIMADPPSYDQL